MQRGANSTLLALEPGASTELRVLAQAMLMHAILGRAVTYREVLRALASEWPARGNSDE